MLWVPPSAVEKVNFTCACGLEFQDIRKGQMHAVKCAQRDGNEFAAEAFERQENFAPLDPEGWEWGRKRIAEGKPGFKRGRPA